ncbi:hypothetical protein BC937DRAFT_93148 [Endogone sp. FLAS-F59071]|nr:hypothetical protein BC937DRAFT_93148 [Endogone sp. FLAS-F59071]|eukprot:RUS21269.1 hypothetical protein BC937DRAFT_93148 [Endogone sp. FLAS-F59071]
MATLTKDQLASYLKGLPKPKSTPQPPPPPAPPAPEPTAVSVGSSTPASPPTSPASPTTRPHGSNIRGPRPPPASTRRTSIPDSPAHVTSHQTPPSPGGASPPIEKSLPPASGGSKTDARYSSIDNLMNDLTLDDPSVRHPLPRTPRPVVSKKPAVDAFEASLRYYPQSGTPITPRARPSQGPKPSSAVTRPPSSTSKPPPAASKPLVTPPRSKPLPPVVAATQPTPPADIGERVAVRNPLADTVRCAGCEEPISGQIMTALGKHWHPDHFVCKHCGTELEHVEFQEKDGNPYCHLDYHELFSPRCEYCKTPIEDECIMALGKTYHRLHFFCRECGNPFEGGFMVHDGHPYCEKDYIAKFGKKCKACGLHIRGEFVSAMGGDWHKHCFVCELPFDTTSFYIRDNKPYCETHLRSANPVPPLPKPQLAVHVCDVCQSPIAGRAVLALGRKFHPEHFTCTGCDRELSPNVPGMWRVNEEGDRPICLACLGREESVVV